MKKVALMTQYWEKYRQFGSDVEYTDLQIIALKKLHHGGYYGGAASLESDIQTISASGISVTIESGPRNTRLIIRRIGPWNNSWLSEILTNPSTWRQHDGTMTLESERAQQLWVGKQHLLAYPVFAHFRPVALLQSKKLGTHDNGWRRLSLSVALNFR